MTKAIVELDVKEMEAVGGGVTAAEYLAGLGGTTASDLQKAIARQQAEEEARRRRARQDALNDLFG